MLTKHSRYPVRGEPIRRERMHGIVINSAWATETNAPRLCGSHSSTSALQDQCPLELGNDAEQLDNHAANRGRRVEGFGQRAETRTSRLDLLQHTEQVEERAGKTINFVDEHFVTGFQASYQGLKARPRPDAAALLLNNPNDASTPQRVTLQGGVLFHR